MAKLIWGAQPSHAGRAGESGLQVCPGPAGTLPAPGGSGHVGLERRRARAVAVTWGWSFALPGSSGRWLRLSKSEAPSLPARCRPRLSQCWPGSVYAGPGQPECKLPGRCHVSA